MSRSSTPLWLALALVTGALLGVLLERGGTARLNAQAAAQVGTPASTTMPPTPASPTVRPPSLGRAANEDALYEQLARQYAQFEHVNRTFELVSQVVSPAVVHIIAQKTGQVDETKRTRHYEETGSGVIVRGDGIKGLFVLTNNHVVEGAAPAKISVFLQDGRALRPDQVWLDPKADIAVLNLNRDDLPAARFGNSDEMKVGDWVLALGSPFGLTHSVSQGIISARGRHMDELQDVENQDFLQTDAAINPGHSGGPLVNMKGELIGINNSIASNGGGNEGVGFSIPINLARWIMGQLISKGRVSRGALGIDLHPDFRSEDAQTLGLERPRGAWIDVVHPGSPAAAAGLKDDDVILRFQGAEVRDLNDLINRVSMAPIGQPCEVVVWRGKQLVALSVTVGDRERTIAQMGGPPPGERLNNTPRGGQGGLLRRPERPMPTTTFALGLELDTLDETVSRRLGLPPALKGAVVLKIAPESPLSALLKPMDVIHAINGHPVKSAEEASRALTAHVDNATLLVSFDRIVNGVVQSRTVQLQ
ncbi:MAG: trypsin-like peptidase domain-containing protein [Isosphaeraceae bacterium]